MKKFIMILVCVLLVGAAIGVFFAVRHNNAYIGSREALEIAMKDAGVNEADVIEKDAEFEKKGSKAWYDVDFETFTTEYDYNIDAKTGEILSRHSEPRD